MDEWKEGVWLGVSAFITAMLLTFAVVMGSVSQGVARLQQNDINVVASLQEYRKWVKYDNVIVNQADVINCILENRTNVPAVAATRTPAPDTTNPPFSTPPPAPGFTGYYLLNGTGWVGANNYSVDMLNTYIPLGATYRARLVKDANGAVLYIWFRRVP